MRYNGILIPTAIRPDAKLGKLTTSEIGVKLASDYNLDGWNVVDVKPQQLTVTEKDYLCGNPFKHTLVLDETITALQCVLGVPYPNLNCVVVGYAQGVVTGLGTALDGLTCTVVVPNTLLSDYQTAYVSFTNLTFATWTASVDYTLPFIGETTLTAEYVNAVAAVLGAQAGIVTHLTIPNDFTAYQSGAIKACKTMFTSMSQLDSPWCDGLISSLNLYLTTNVARVITQADMDYVSSFQTNEGILIGKLTCSPIFTEDMASSNIFWGFIAQNANIKKLEIPFRLNTRGVENLGGVYVSQPYVEEITINKTGNYDVGYFVWSTRFSVLKKIRIKSVTGYIYFERGGESGSAGGIHELICDEATTFRTEAWDAFNSLVFDGSGSVCKLSKATTINWFLVSNLDSLYLGTSNCVLSGTLRGVTTIYVPRGSISYYQNASGWSAHASKFVEYDPA